MTTKRYNVKNVSGDQVVLDVVTKEGLLIHMPLAKDETIWGLNEQAMKFFWQYIACGMMTVEVAGNKPIPKPDWRREGF